MNSNSNDYLYRFVFEQFGVRGEFVRLASSWQAVRERHQYPKPIAQQLGGALAAVLLLSGTIKFKGSLTLQLQGDGVLRTVLAQATEQRTVRGMAQYDQQQAEVPQDLDALIGTARLSMIAEAPSGERYQGIVALEKGNLASAVEDYFTRSEQLPTRLFLATNQDYAAGLFLQRLPGDTQDEENWRRVSLLAETLKDEELLNLDVQTLLHRLFHEEDVRLFEPEAVAFRCSCSRQRIADAILAMGEQEVMQLLEEQGAIEANCEFCHAHYEFDQVDISGLFHHASETDETVRH